MTTTYLITPPDAADRMRAFAYPTREAAMAASTKSDYVVGGSGDIIWTGRTMVDVFNALTGSRLKKFETRADGAKRIMQALPAIATEVAPTEEKDAVDKEERAAAKAAKAQAAADAKAAKQQEREAAKQAAADAKAEKQQAREAAKAARAAAKQTNGARQRFAADARIKMLVSENPKKYGAASERFKLYRDGMSVEEALKSGILRADLSWDTKKGFIAVEA